MLSKYRKTVIIIAITVLLFIKLCQNLIKNELSMFDQNTYNYLQLFASERVTAVMTVVTHLGSTYFFIAIVFLSLVLFRRNRINNRYAKLIALNFVGIWILNKIIKVAFHRERPDIMPLINATGYSFPSGHSMLSFSVYGFIIYILYKSRKGGLIKYLSICILSLTIVLIGISRIYLGVHYASDVIGGYLAAFAWLVLLIQLENN